MNNEEIFLNIKELPKPLSKEETYELFNKLKMGDKNAKNILIEHNIRLVVRESIKYFKNNERLKKDIVAVGIIGLINAVNAFDVSKNFAFSSYGTKCINNEIKKYLRKNKEKKTLESFSKVVWSDNENEIKLEDTIEDNKNMIENYIDKEINIIIKEIIYSLNEKEFKLLKMYYGFGQNKRYTQKELSQIYGISQPDISRKISKVIGKIRKKLEIYGVIEGNYSKTKVKKYY
ncbi:MAG: sigma-70 family RNA polymerase sigma factor [Bacilli bacterium]|nr:sigma-70 family RNA polymerase sigma factor [Bacilli bacterium]